ncbi:TetR/AcrR family transcriptional regulator [Rhodococcus ruber]|uniref:TetR/AcrR family transcriptional regulator n=1 Tax=Rhodococcus ruber TaxID=1830 RepID=UPI000E6B000C|nr:TetR/AcrR family transcriptional regulator [Rhodococcus ruber]AXY49261.1 TetR family transcriptional regulator [Rhodococcus ruber]
MVDRPSGIDVRRRNARRESSEAYDERRRQLVHAAAKIFRDRGFHGASINDIATELGGDRASVYYYVSSKKELFELVIEDAVLDNVRTAERVQAGSDSPEVKLRAILVGLMRSYESHYPHLFVFLQEDADRLAGNDEKWRVRMQEWSRRYFQTVRAVIQEGIETGVFASGLPVTILAQGVVGMVSWSHRWYQPSGDVSANDIGAGFAEVLLAGLLR